MNNRKGRTFLIYEFEVKIKWEGETRDEAGAVLESTKGSMRLPDVCATEIDDPEVEFESENPNPNPNAHPNPNPSPRLGECAAAGRRVTPRGARTARR